MFITPIMHHFIQIAFVLFREVKAGFYITLVDSYWIQNRGLNSDGQKSFKHKGKDIHMCPGSTGPTVYDGGLPCALKRATLFFPSSASFPIINPSSLDYHAICKHVSVIWCQRQTDSRLTASRRSFSKVWLNIIFRKRRAPVPPLLFFFSLSSFSSWMEEDGKSEKKEKTV